jgi:hypothetical protein
MAAANFESPRIERLPIERAAGCGCDCDCGSSSGAGGGGGKPSVQQVLRVARKSPRQSSPK